LEPLSTQDGVEVGGAAALAAYWQSERTPTTLTLGAGNSFGTSPPISNLFGDVPAVRAMNLMGFDADTLGDDNFDGSLPPLQHLINIANFDFVVSNLERLEENLQGVTRYRIFDLEGIRVAVIGVMDPGSRDIVFPGNFGTMEIGDPVAAAVQARADAARDGAGVVVLLTEVGAETADSGPLLDLAAALTGFDVVLGNSFGADFSTNVNGALVVGNEGRGATYARTVLTFDPDRGSVTGKDVSFVRPITSSTTPMAALEELVATYRSLLADRLLQVVATAQSEVPVIDVCGQALGRTCESPAGSLIADALRYELGTDFALLNSGAIRGPLTCPLQPVPGRFCPAFQPPPYPITEGQLQAALPFGNRAVTVTLNGTELRAFLEHGVSAMPAPDGRFPQVSGLCFSYDISRPAGSRVVQVQRQDDDGDCGGALDLTARANYSLATNDFIAAGGDGYPIAAAPPQQSHLVLDLLRSHLEEGPAIQASVLGRISCIAGVAMICPAAGIHIGPSQIHGSPTGAAISPPSTGDAGLPR
jgi:5'-nucleotidase